MARKSGPPTTPTLTTERAARLYKLLTLLGVGPQTRRALLLKLKLDIRSFYRDLKALRNLGIEVGVGVENRYILLMSLDDALARLPFPDPGLNVRDVLQLCKGESAAHRKLRQRVNSFLHPTPRSR